MNNQGWSPLGLTGLISLSRGLSRVFSSTVVQKHQFLGGSAFLVVQFSHPYMTAGKSIALTIWTSVSKVMSLLFNMLSRLVIAFLLRSKHLFNFMAAVTVRSYSGVQENKIYHFSPIYLPWSNGTGCHVTSFLNVEFYIFIQKTICGEFLRFKNKNITSIQDSSRNNKATFTKLPRTCCYLIEGHFSNMPELMKCSHSMNKLFQDTF